MLIEATKEGDSTPPENKAEEDGGVGQKPWACGLPTSAGPSPGVDSRH